MLTWILLGWLVGNLIVGMATPLPMFLAVHGGDDEVSKLVKWTSRITLYTVFLPLMVILVIFGLVTEGINHWRD